MLKAIYFFIKEHIDNRRYIMKLAVSSATRDTQNTTLGIYWNVVRDAVFFIAYSFFMVVIRGSNSNIEGMPRLVYLYTGLVAWYLINDYLTLGVKCIVRNKNIFSKIRFPIMIIPTIETIAIIIRRLITLALLAIILIVFMIFTDYRVNINIIGLVYSLIASFVFGLAWSMFISGFYAISKDFRELYLAIMRIQFYFVPIFWSVNQDIARAGLPHIVQTTLNNLPFIHLINAFRRSISLGEIPPIKEIMIFSLITAIIFAVGCYLQYRLRRIYADFI